MKVASVELNVSLGTIRSNCADPNMPDWISSTIPKTGIAETHKGRGVTINGKTYTTFQMASEDLQMGVKAIRSRCADIRYPNWTAGSIVKGYKRAEEELPKGYELWKKGAQWIKIQ